MQFKGKLFHIQLIKPTEMQWKEIFNFIHISRYKKWNHPAAIFKNVRKVQPEKRRKKQKKKKQKSKTVNKNTGGLS